MNVVSTKGEAMPVVAVSKLSVDQHADAIRGLLKNRVENVIEIGEQLSQVKAKLDHGEFLPWIDAECGLSERSVQGFMRVSRVFGSQIRKICGFAVSALYLLAQPSTPEAAMKEALKRAQKGEKITHALAKQLIEKHSEGDNDTDILRSSKSVEWYTPKKYIEAARALMGSIDLDPASTAKANKVVKAKEFFTEKDDGLQLEWCGNIFLNPPYGKDGDGVSNQAVWSRALIEEYGNKSLKQAVLLVNAQTAEKWFQPLWDYPICFTDHRIKFYNDKGQQNQPTHGNVFAYLGKQTNRFVTIFSDFGRVVVPKGPFGIVR